MISTVALVSAQVEQVLGDWGGYFYTKPLVGGANTIYALIWEYRVPY